MEEKPVETPTEEKIVAKSVEEQPIAKREGLDRTVSVTRQGGYVAQAISSRTPNRTVLSVNDGLAAAQGVLERRRLGPMAESYHVLEGNALTVTYCAREGEAICYPDMVKITVAMDNGELLRYDAEGYLTCHGPREFPAPALSAEDAAGRVPRLFRKRKLLIYHRLREIQNLFRGFSSIFVFGRALFP